MNVHIRKTTAAILAIIFFVGLFPYALTKFFNINSQKQGQNVRLVTPEGKIKIIPLEEYLIGVVAAEMPAEFELEALKAQAVASRTYVLKKMGEQKSQTFDVGTTELTQVWNSNQTLFRKWGIVDYLKYHSKIARAVQETAGKIITDQGQKIDAVFFSSCGRKSTERANEVWSGDARYLTNVPSAEATPLRFVKHQVYDIETFYRALGFTQIPAAFTENDLIVIERTKAGRIKTMAIRNKVFLATDLRVKLQLPSTDIEWHIQGNKIEVITYGKGHAVGMSQYGANDLAKAGRQYTDILGHFYPGTKLEKAY